MGFVSRALRRGLDAIYLLSGILAGIGVVAIGILMMLLSVGREIGLNVRGGDEITGWTLAASSFLGLAYTFKHGDLIRVTLLIERFTGQSRRWMEVAVLAIGACFIGAFAWYCSIMVYDSWRFNEMAQGVLSVPIWIPQSGLALGAIILTIAFLDEMIRVLGGHNPCYVKEAPKTIEELIERAAESAV